VFDQAHAADGILLSGRPRRPSGQATSRSTLQWTLEAITGGVAFVRNAHQDLLAANALGRVLLPRHR
jgi:hypothetical protein